MSKSIQVQSHPRWPMHTLRMSNFAIGESCPLGSPSEKGWTVLPSDSHALHDAASTICPPSVPIPFMNPNRHTHPLQSPFYSASPTSLDTSPLFGLLPSFF